MPASSQRGPARIALIAVLGLVAGVLVSPAVAPMASATPAITVVDSPVDDAYDAQVGPDGTTYVVGDFTEVGAATGGIARLDATPAATPPRPMPVPISPAAAAPCAAASG